MIPPPPPLMARLNITLYSRNHLLQANRRMKTVERWGSNPFVRCATSVPEQASTCWKGVRSQLMRRVVELNRFAVGN